MSGLAEKMKSAGVDTIGARLTTVCIEGLRLSPNNARQAWDHAFNEFGRHFVMGIIEDMASAPTQTEKLIRDTQSQPVAIEPFIRFDPDKSPSKIFREETSIKPYQPRVIAPERLEKRREFQQIVRSKYKNSGGVVWSDVGWHELHGLKRDGAEAKALLDSGPANVPNTGGTVGDILGVKRVDEIIAMVRGK